MVNTFYIILYLSTIKNVTDFQILQHKEYPRLYKLWVLYFRSAGVQFPTERKRFFESSLIVKSRALKDNIIILFTFKIFTKIIFTVYFRSYTCLFFKHAYKMTARGKSKILRDIRLCIFSKPQHPFGLVYFCRLYIF